MKQTNGRNPASELAAQLLRAVTRLTHLLPQHVEALPCIVKFNSSFNSDPLAPAGGAVGSVR